jgi:hypothetical protein
MPTLGMKGGAMGIGHRAKVWSSGVLLAVLALAWSMTGPAHCHGAQVRIMPLGDSITTGVT